MSATTLVVQERILERRTSARRSATSPLTGLIAEVVQVLAGSVVAVAPRGAELDPALRRDLGMD